MIFVENHNVNVTTRVLMRLTYLIDILHHCSFPGTLLSRYGEFDLFFFTLSRALSTRMFLYIEFFLYRKATVRMFNVNTSHASHASHILKNTQIH